MESEDGPKKLDRRFSAISSKGSDDREAKVFSPDKDMCSVYIYKEFDFFQLPYPPTVTLGRLKDEPVPGSGYLHINVSRGQHLMQVDNESVEFNLSIVICPF